MNPFFLSALKEHVRTSLADLLLESRDSIEAPRQVNIFIGDLPPKRRTGDAESLSDPHPCIVVVPFSGQWDRGEDVVTVAFIYTVYCPEDGDAEGAEMDHALLLSRIKQSLYPCCKLPLHNKYRLTEDSKGRLFAWEKSDLQARPYMQATLMTHWRMKGLE